MKFRRLFLCCFGLALFHELFEFSAIADKGIEASLLLQGGVLGVIIGMEDGCHVRFD